MERQNKLLLDLSGIIDAETLHEYLSKKLNFPGYYGFNFDAFWDCVRDDAQSSMPNTLFLEGLSEFAKNLPAEYEKFMDCMSDYEKEFSDRRVVYRNSSPSGEGISFEE